MELINETALDRAIRKYRDSASWLSRWAQVVKAAQWQSLQDIRSDFASADGVKLKSGVVVTVFNVREKSGQKMPPGVMMSGTREAFLEAAQSVKARALGQNLKKP